MIFNLRSSPVFHGLRLRAFTPVLALLMPLASRAQTTSSNIGAFKSLTLAQLMDIEVTSVSRRPETLSQAASAIQVITGEDIRRAGATRLPAALRLLSNLQVAQIDARQWAIAARGFNNTVTNKLLVQMDGRTLYTPLFAGVFWDVQDTLLDDLDRIEVISGPGGTQWGGNAVNGVINFTTKSAKDTQGGLVNATMGTELESAGAVRYGGTLAPGVFYRIYGKHTERDSTVLASGADAEDNWRTTQGGFRVDWERNHSDMITFQGDAYRGKIGQPNAGDIEVSGANLIGRWTRTFAPRSELSVQTYVDYTRRDIPATFNEGLTIFDLDLQHRLPLGSSNDFMWGANYRAMDDRIDNGRTLAFLPENAQQEWFSGFVQNEMSLLDERLRLTAGLKIERNPYSKEELQPSVRAAWRWRERRLFWAAISRAVRTPSRIDREFFVPATPPFVIAGGPSFMSEKLIAYELGYRAEARTGLALSLAAFYNDYDDLRSLEPGLAPGEPSLIGNGIRGRSYGAELSVDTRLNEWWRLRFGYTELRITTEKKPGSRSVTSTRSEVLDPKRTALLHSQIDLRANISLDVLARYVARIEEQDIPAYTQIDVRVSWRPRDELELALAGRNLLDRRHPEFGTMAARREIERGVNGSFTWRF